jgi:hypothetical protein
VSNWFIILYSNPACDPVPFGFHRADDEYHHRIGLGPIAICWGMTDV